jgi:iron uptake system component EfeO
MLAGCAGSSGTVPDAGIAVDVSVSACGRGWASGPAGEQMFVLHNTDTRAGEVDLVDPATGAVYAEVDVLGPAATTTLHADLGAGRYAFRCAMEDEAAVTGAVVVLRGAARGDTPAVRPVSQSDLVAAATDYEGYVEAKLPDLLRLVQRLRGDITKGDLSLARRDWLPAHLAYLLLGAAYGAFGAADERIDGLPDGLPGGVHDPSWRGLHRIEFGLWHGQAAGALLPAAADVVHSVHTLIHRFPTEQIDPLDIGIRAHEITEDAIRFALSGRDDYGSHSTLATVRADLAATRVVLGFVDPMLAPRYRERPVLDDQLALTAADVDRLRTRTGWPALDALSRAERERLDADVSQLAEDLAPVATILEPRRTS